MNERNETHPSILVVDDSSFLRKRVRQALDNDGYTLVEADSGLTALKAIDEQKFACILTDLVMPGLDGFGLLAELRRRGIDAPVVVLTADIQKSTRDKCQELGACEFIQKPMKADELRSALSRALGGR